MKIIFKRELLILLPFIFISCAGDKGAIEEAAYLNAKGGVANATKALALVEKLIASGDAEIRLAATREYAGAKMTMAGFDSVKIISYLVYREGDDTIRIINSAVSLDGNAKTLLEEAETSLTSLIGSTAYTNATLEIKQGLQFQLGLAYLFESARNAIVNGGLSNPSTFSLQACKDSIDAAETEVGQLHADLTAADESFDNAGLEDGNSIRKLIDTFIVEVPPTTSVSDPERDALCEYLVEQNGN